MRYIREIDNLRGIAVLAVVLNHLFPSILPSGFLGVDLFFVISGYVVTNSLIFKSREGNFLKKFYLRRIYRLFPALALMVLLTSLFTTLLVPSSKDYLLTGAASLLGAGNFFLIFKSRGYFSLEAELNPFTHTWSLGVEEQFYLIFPLALYFIIKMCREREGGENRFLDFMASLSVISFGLYLYISQISASWGYYSIFTRFWQIGLGVLAYKYSLGGVKLNSKLRRNLALVSLVLILAMLMFPPNLQLWTRPLLSLAAGFLCIYFASESTMNLPLMSNQILRQVGLFSYSIYLWHWPILSLFKNLTGMSPFLYLLVFLLSAGLSYFSYYFVEVKVLALKSTSKAFYIPVLSFIMLVLFVFLGGNQNLFLGRDTKFSTRANEGWNFEYCSAFRIVQSSDLQGKDYSKCALVNKNTGFTQNKIFILGDSYAQQIIPAFHDEGLLKKFSIYGYTASGCHPLKLTYYAEKPRLGCRKALSNYEKFILEKSGRKDLVILSFSYHYFFNDNLFEDEKENKVSQKVALNQFLKYLSEMKKKVGERGAKLAVISNIPELKLSVPSVCYQPWSKLRYDCESIIDETKTNLRRKIGMAVKNFARKNKILFIDIMKELNREEVLKTQGLYHNQNHLSQAGAKYVRESIFSQLLL